jgi:hypothetical protein
MIELDQQATTMVPRSSAECTQESTKVRFLVIAGVSSHGSCGTTSRQSRRRPFLLLGRHGLLRVILLVAGIVIAMSTQIAAAQNAIQRENSLPGTPGWNDFTAPDAPDTLSGFGSTISVNAGDSIDFYVTTTAPNFTVDIYRTGYYQGIGARLVQSMGSFTGHHQAIPSPDAVTGIVACTNWVKSTTLQVPSTWVSGVYLAKLTDPAGDSSFIFFVVRNDGGHEDILFQSSVTTYEAYNDWGQTSLYANETNKSIYPYAHATKVSFDRPFNPQGSNGAGQYFSYEQYFVFWLEQQGYNVAYTTDVDTDTGVNPLSNHKAFLSVGHDEYWSRGMRTNVENAIAGGVNVGFFSANTMYWQIRFEPNISGVPNRVEVGYKDYAYSPSAPGPDPEWQVDNTVLTTNWRDPLVNQPENALIGVMFESAADGSYVVQNATNWVYANTGFADGTKVPGIVGYEYDKIWNNGFSPAGLTILSQSPVVDGSGLHSNSNSTIYTAPSGARVFASGTIEWSLALANINTTTLANAGIQRATANILNNFLTGTPFATFSPSSINFYGGVVGAASPAQTITITSTGSTTLSLSSISISGTNASDFSQTNNCPATMTTGVSCTVQITFTPGATGTRAATLLVADNTTGSPHSVSLSGLGQSTSGPVVSLTPTSINFGFQNVGTSSAAQPITLSNIGSAPLNISSIGASGSAAGDFITNSNCPQGAGSLTVGSSCIVNVQFSPTQAGSRTASIVITDNAPDSPESISVAGTSISPIVFFKDGFESGDLSQWTLASSDSTGQRKVETTVTNNGQYAAAFTNASGQYSYIYTALPGGPQTQTFTRFYFQATNVGTSSMLALARNANGGNTWEVDYDANRHGLDIYFWNSSGGTYSLFSPVNGIVANTWYCVELQDTQTTAGQAEVWINGASVGSVSANLANSNPMARLLLINGVTGTFYFDDVVVANVYNGPAQPTPVISVNPSSLSFGTWGVNGAGEGVSDDPPQDSQTLTILNKGNAPLNFGSFTISGANASDFSAGQCSGALAPNASCLLTVTFNPTALGSRGANLVITDNDPTSPQTIQLSGTGINPGPAVAVAPASLNFGSQMLTTTNSQTITVTSDGTSPLSISSIAVAGTSQGDFTEQDNCPIGSTTLAVNASCTITITFNPTANGARDASITIVDNAADSPQSVPLSGSGYTATLYFNDGFETGDFSQWNLPNGDSNGQLSVQTTVKHSGAYAAAVNIASGQYAYLYTALSGGPQTQTFTRFYFQTTNVGTSTILAEGRNANGGETWEVDYNGNRHGLDFYFWTSSGSVYSISSATQVIAANTWYSIEIEDNQTTAGKAEVWLNGASIGAVDADLSNPNPMARLLLFDQVVGTFYFDDVSVANVYQ